MAFINAAKPFALSFVRGASFAAGALALAWTVEKAGDSARAFREARAAKKAVTPTAA